MGSEMCIRDRSYLYLSGNVRYEGENLDNLSMSGIHMYIYIRYEGENLGNLSMSRIHMYVPGLHEYTEVIPKYLLFLVPVRCSMSSQPVSHTNSILVQVLNYFRYTWYTRNTLASSYY